MANGKGLVARSYLGYDMKAASDEAALLCSDPSLTVQSDKDDADINVLVERFGIGFVDPHDVRQPLYGDFTGVVDYQSALHAIQAADESFMSMSAKVRSRFDNDPQKFLAFVNDPANKAEAVELGLVEKPLPAPEPQKVFVVGAAAPVPGTDVPGVGKVATR